MCLISFKTSHLKKVRTVICEWLAWVLRMKRPGRDLSKKGIDRKASMRDLEQRKPASNSLLSNVLDHGDDDFYHAQNCYPLSGVKVNSSRSSVLLQREEISTILKEVRYITNKMRGDADADEEIGDWKFAAMVIDRLCLYVFTTYTFIATTVIFVSVPHIFEWNCAYWHLNILFKTNLTLPGIGTKNKSKFQETCNS